jgi:rubrerythrin
MQVRIEWLCPKCGIVAQWVDLGSLNVKCPICGTPYSVTKEKDLCSSAAASCTGCKEC